MNQVTLTEPTTNNELHITTRAGFPISKSGSIKIEKTGLLRNSLSIVKTYSLSLSVGIENSYVNPNKSYFRKSWTLSYYKQNKNGQFAKRLDTITLENKSVAEIIGLENQQKFEQELVGELTNQLQNAINAISDYELVNKYLPANN